MRALPGFPGSHLEVWVSWLEYRIPHWDEMERLAAATLTGSQCATVRVGWDSAIGAPREWHATLFTLTSQTPKPDQTVAAAREFKPAGFLLHHVLTDEPHPESFGPPDARPGDLAALVEEALEARRGLAAIENDPRAGARTRDRASRASEALVDRARTDVEQAITDGLGARNGSLLIPPMIVKPDMLNDWMLYKLALALHSALAPPGGDQIPWKPRGIAVCRACTAVFVPRRRATGEFCRLCQKRPAEPFVVGQRPLGPGTRQTVRAPKLAGNMILGWRTVTIGLCPDCGAAFTGRRDAIACPDCANRFRQRRYREREQAVPLDGGDPS